MRTSAWSQLLGRVLMAMALGLGGPLNAEVILGLHDWDPNPGSAAWTNVYGWTTIDAPSTGGNTGGWLRTTFPTVTVPESSQTGWYDVVYTKATNLYAGTWSTNVTVRMDFWASNRSPGAVQVQWQSAANINIWGYELTPPATGVWATLSAPFMNWSAWQYPGATEAQFLSDLASIDWIGVYIYRNTADLQVYGLDNFLLSIPEPAEYLLLALAMAATGLSFRRKRARRLLAADSA